ncbi:hypothetical protein C366_02905 [Cryptococcus neoformans Tu401-1]|nr:hypothetical protein C365_03060 [Cryptococcus neoformans var. grubii Bt85]OXG18794.1 hypothetical protein C366_02905 [Cryptococcus neoformans var. grubii Tu401-1]OXM79377.1 hypothetical protein C364_02874 [Cryptococcus neoformans var. grubii Bt63]
MYGTRIILLSAAVVVVLPRTTTTTMSDMMDDASLQILPGTGPDFLEMFPITTMLQCMKREVMGVMHKNGGKK